MQTAPTESAWTLRSDGERRSSCAASTPIGSSTTKVNVGGCSVHCSESGQAPGTSASQQASSAAAAPTAGPATARPAPYTASGTRQTKIGTRLTYVADGSPPASLTAPACAACSSGKA